MENELVFPTMKDSDGMHCRPSGGITKREYFAGLIIQGMLANTFMSRAFSDLAAADGVDAGVVFAGAAIRTADNLIAALDAKIGKEALAEERR